MVDRVAKYGYARDAARCSSTCRSTIGASARSSGPPTRPCAVVGPVARALRRRRRRAAAAADPAAAARADRRSADVARRRSRSVRALAPDADDRPRGRQLERRSGAGRSRASIASRRWTPPGSPARGRGGHARRCCAQARRLARAVATISRSTSSPTSAATCSSRPPARRRTPASRAAAAARCSTSRSTTTRGAHRRQRAAAGRARRSAPTLGAQAARLESGRSATPERRARATLLAARRAAARCSRRSTSSGGRAIKQWPPERFAEVGRTARARSRGATIVLTGSAGDRALVDTVRVGAAGGSRDRSRRRRSICRPSRPCSSGSTLFVTGDTGPMHLAAAVGTPIVAVFGPSDPARYAPRGGRAPRRAHRSPVQPVQSHPAAAGALRRPHARLPDGHRRRCGVRAATTPRSKLDSDGTWRPGTCVERMARSHDRTSRESRASRDTVDRRPCDGSATGRPATISTRRSERAHDDAYAWIKALRHLARRRRAVSRPVHLSAATRCGGSPSCTCTSSRRSSTLLRRLCGVRRAGRARAAAAIDVGDGPDRVVSPAAGGASASASAYSGPVRCAADRTTLASAPDVARARARGSPRCVRAADRSRPRRPPADAARRSRRSCTPRSGGRIRRRDGGAESYIGPVLRALERAARSRQSATSASARAPTSARGAGGTRCVAARRARSVMPIERLRAGAALRGSRAVWRDRHRERRALLDSADAARRAP